ncbi:hypothetical protein LBMAG42_57110 [Deltaproteobacteria bacterium]|nr:hypothetical protein LBMAG42_57110 [Deltaproteobacteria bacterium]
MEDRTLSSSSAAALYGLQVGAKWTFLRTDDVLRWKGITGCEACMITLALPEPIPEVGRLTTPDLRRYVPSPGPWRSGFASSSCRPLPQ